jgi:ubiquinone/menaquinone biosynthesis C-methylase UbiE
MTENDSPLSEGLDEVGCSPLKSDTRSSQALTTLDGRRTQPNELSKLADMVLGACGAGRLLDVGSGDGGLVRTLLREGVDALGVDADESAVRDATQCLGEHFTCASALALPFPDGDFETAVCIDTLHLLPETEIPLALKELARVARSSVFVRLQTRVVEVDDAAGLATAQARCWWDGQFFEAGFRKHPLHLGVAGYESLEDEGAHIDLVFEKLTPATLDRFPLARLKEERDLHMDMLRETGRRAEAHVVRYWAAAPYVRPGDTVLDVACGLGYGSAVIAAETGCRAVIGIDNSEFAIEYATSTTASRYPCVEFRCGDAAHLSNLEDNSVDFVTSFETLEHLPDPEGFLAEINRVLRPGGRVIVSVPNMWVDETGQDPNPFHLHVYDWGVLREQIRAGFRLEAGFAQVAGGGMTLNDRPRRIARFPSTEDPTMEAEWWLAMAMKSPLDAADVPYVETHFPAHDELDGFHVTDFARDYDNPWLIRGLVAIGLRSTDEHELGSMADEVARSAAEGSADRGAAICIQAYRLLGSGDTSEAQAQQMVGALLAYRDGAQSSPHAQRWRISCSYVAAMLLMSIGRRDEARRTFLDCGAADATVFSPLLGSKTVDALYHAGLLSACDGDATAAADAWLRGLKEAHRLITGDWTNVWGSPEDPLSFGLPEVQQLCDLATRCAFALRSAEDWASRPAAAWREAHRNADREHQGLQQQVDDLSNWTGQLDELQESGWARVVDLEGDLQSSREQAARLQGELDEIRGEFDEIRGEFDEVRQSREYRWMQAVSRVRLALLPEGSRRDRVVWLTTRAVAGLRRGPLGPFRAVREARRELADGEAVRRQHSAES